MSIWNKILLGLVFVASLVFFYTAARTVKTNKYWREKAIEFTKLLEAEKKKNHDLFYADNETIKLENKGLGIERLQVGLNHMLINRGRIWENCEPQKVDADKGQVAVNLDSAAAGKFSVNMILYAFEDSEGARAGQYVGEFKVMEAADKQVVLAPTMAMTPREIKRLSASKGRWLLYELMPVDRHEVFADVADDQKKAMLPEAALNEYVRDGQPAAADDPQERKADGKYQRRLRDYKELFRACHVDRMMFVDSYEALTRDAQYLKDSLADAQQQLQFAEREVAGLKADLAVAQKEETAVLTHRALLESRLAGLQQIVADRIKDNLRLAAEIARLQLDAAKRIDERSRTMAQFGRGAN